MKFKPKFIRIQGLLVYLMPLCSLEVDYRTILGLYNILVFNLLIFKKKAMVLYSIRF